MSTVCSFMTSRSGRRLPITTLLSLTLAALFVSTSLTLADAKPIKSLADAEAVLAEPMSEEQAQLVNNWFKARYPKKVNLTKGPDWPQSRPEEDMGKTVAWYIQAPADAKVAVVTRDGKQRWDLKPLGKTGGYATVVKLPNHTMFEYSYTVNGRKVGDSHKFNIDNYKLGPLSQRQEGVPQGKVIAKPRHTSKIVYPGTERDWWVYVPAQYDPDGPPAALAVFLDGGGYAKSEGGAPVVFDNLIHQGKMPVTIGVFVNPGEFPPAKEGQKPRSNRGNEYDTCTAQNVEFLEKEILAEVEKEYKISKNPSDRMICGASSGGSGSFTAAWFRPDLFGKVVSQIGSFCDFRPIQDYPERAEGKNVIPMDQFGPWKTAHSYPALIRKTRPAKAIKVFLQDGSNDNDNQLGNWFLANQQMAKALAYSDYDFTFVTGEGTHSRAHGMSIFPETMIWMWKDHPAPSAESK